jgi:DNA mismatch repair protein MutS2
MPSAKEKASGERRHRGKTSPCSSNSLDEVGARTDPMRDVHWRPALLQYLADRAILTSPSTHYGELKALKYQDSRFENTQSFDDVKLTPTASLLWGFLVDRMPIDRAGWEF